MPVAYSLFFMDNKLVFLFPGQGSQYVGMVKGLCQEYPQALNYFLEAESILGADLKKLAWEGPAEVLNQDLWAQLSMFTANAAAYEALTSTNLSPAVVCGYSMGFYSALYAAGCFDFPTGLHLVRKAGELMLELSEKRPGTMGVIIGLLKEEAETICREITPPPSPLPSDFPLDSDHRDEQTIGMNPVNVEGETRGRGFVALANLNAARQLIVSGDSEAVAAALKLAVEKGALEVQSLPVGAAYHTSLMEPAARRFAEEIKTLSISAPKIPVLNYTTVDYIKDAGEVSWLLWNQLINPVRWRECVQRLSGEGYSQYIECGPGGILSKMIRWIDRQAVIYRAEDLEAVKKLK
jgi:[acyl-carrier-protein] S-malonyltransferase